MVDLQVTKFPTPKIYTPYVSKCSSHLRPASHPLAILLTLSQAVPCSNQDLRTEKTQAKGLGKYWYLSFSTVKAQIDKHSYCSCSTVVIPYTGLLNCTYIYVDVVKDTSGLLSCMTT